MDVVKEILTAYQQYMSDEGCEIIERSRVVNDVDLNAFNYSVEEPVLRKFGSFFNITSDYKFGVVQPCIRMRDAQHICDDPYHLSQFTILPIPFALYKKHSPVVELDRRRILRQAVHFLTEKIGVALTNIEVSYFAGGNIRQLIDTCSDFYIEPDLITYNVCRECGISKKQLIGNSTKENFLCQTVIPGEFYSGYRYEIYYKNGNIRYELGTGENLFWKQKKNSGEVEIIPINSSVIGLGLGLERCIMAAMGSARILDLPMLTEMEKICRRWFSGINDLSLLQFTDALRTMHLISADGGLWTDLNKRRREHVKRLMRRILFIADSHGIALSMINDVLSENAKAQYWLPELKNSISITMDNLRLFLKWRKDHGC